MTNTLRPAARVVLFTADACISAHIATGGERVKDVLNSPATTLELLNITYSNPDRPGVPLVEYPSGLVRKSEVACIIALSEPPLEALRKIGVYVQKRPVALSVVIPGMVIVGTYHAQGRFDPVNLLTDPPEPFIPLTDAGLVRSRTTAPTAIAPERLTIFVNRVHVTGIFLADADESAGLDGTYAQPARGTGMLQQSGLRQTGSLAPTPARATGPLSAPVSYGSGHNPGSRGTGQLPTAPATPGTAPFKPLSEPSFGQSPEPQRAQTGRLRRFTNNESR
jgi:hypothetical protein